MHNFSIDRHLSQLAMGLLSLGLILGSGGCTICQDCGDLDYPTFGGAWQRTRRDSGRVGSIFDPAGARTATLTDRNDADEWSNRGIGTLDASESDDPGSGGRRQSEGGDSAPSPSDRPRGELDADRLRSLELDEISVEIGQPDSPEI